MFLFNINAAASSANCDIYIYNFGLARIEKATSNGFSVERVFVIPGNILTMLLPSNDRLF
jgi:hypothetical protein